MRQSNKKRKIKKKEFLDEHFPVLVLSLLHEKEPFFFIKLVQELL